MSTRRTVRRNSRPSTESEGRDNGQREAPSPQAPSEPPTSRSTADAVLDAPVTRLATDDLLALADMDPAELAAAMEGSLRSTRLEVGAEVTGTVARVGRDDLFLDLGGKAEGRLDRAELPEATVGDQVTAYVLRTGEMGVTLSTRLSGAAAADHIEAARESGIPVQGAIVKRNSGGFEVRIGSVRAFCPVSMISRLPSVDLDSYVGQTLDFRVIETGDKVVVNRRILQEEAFAEKAEALWSTLEEGQEFGGVVRNVLDFGAFVDIGGIEGLVPRREQGWGSGDLRPGQTVEVRVIDLDRANRKITLSARMPSDDPWHLVGSRFATGGIYEGAVVSVTSFGAFVELAPGLQGLVHISKLPGGAPPVGTEINVRLLSVDLDRRRLELAPAAEGEEPSTGEEATGTVSQVLNNGVVVQLNDGRTGWLSAREVDLPHGTVLAQRFRVGKEVTARVLGDDRNRVTLTLKEADTSWQPAPSAQKSGGGGFGTLGDLLGGLKLDR